MLKIYNNVFLYLCDIKTEWLRYYCVIRKVIYIINFLCYG